MQYLEGDILFQDLGCGAVCDAINGSTPGWKGAELNHCGMLVGGQHNWIVIEAISPRVRETTLDDFLSRSVDELSRPRILQARLHGQYSNLVPAAVNFAKSQLGVRYDGRFGPDSTALYCSELVVDAFWHANGKQAFFKEKPMSFSNPGSDIILDFWIQYYAFFNEEVPQGKLGSNPGDLSLSSKFSDFNQLGSLRGIQT